MLTKVIPKKYQSVIDKVSTSKKRKSNLAKVKHRTLSSHVAFLFGRLVSGLYAHFQNLGGKATQLHHFYYNLNSHIKIT